MAHLPKNDLMVTIHEHRDPSGPAPLLAGRARAFALLLVLTAFLVAPFVVVVGTPQNATAPRVVQVVSNPSKINKACPKKSLPGQPNACASSSAPVAGFEGRSVIPPRVAERSRIAPVYDVTLTTQCCGAPPDRPPRFAA